MAGEGFRINGSAKFNFRSWIEVSC